MRFKRTEKRKEIFFKTKKNRKFLKSKKILQRRLENSNVNLKNRFNSLKKNTKIIYQNQMADWNKKSNMLKGTKNLSN